MRRGRHGDDARPWPGPPSRDVLPLGAQTFLPASPVKVFVVSPFLTRIFEPDW